MIIEQRKELHGVVGKFRLCWCWHLVSKFRAANRSQIMQETDKVTRGVNIIVGQNKLIRKYA